MVVLELFIKLYIKLKMLVLNLVEVLMGLFIIQTEVYNNCSNVYTQILKNHNIRISMTEENHCYENTVLNVLTEFYLDQVFSNLENAKIQQKIPSNYTN